MNELEYTYPHHVITFRQLERGIHESVRYVLSSAYGSFEIELAAVTWDLVLASLQ